MPSLIQVVETSCLSILSTRIKLQKSNPTDGITTSNTKYDEYMNHSEIVAMISCLDLDGVRFLPNLAGGRDIGL